jgi:hypothetical protein
VFKSGFRLPQRADPLAAREFVDFRGDDPAALDRRLQPAPGLDVALEARVPAVDEQQRADLPLLPEEGPGQLLERPGREAPAACVTKPWEIDEVERLATSPRDAIDVREPGLAGCRAGARDFLPDQRVDQARLPDIRTPHERDFRPAVAGEVGRAGAARDESGFDLQ